ncbi:MAG: twin transmembrane helix small protein [Gammaproteobacteria bacterium TMED119]|nr:MAG: twin transmembrane helix small protein [Gammaproteobacteria bacterium TMED119]RCL44626.1 MAG: twin transmembrane helix small protein [Candidatus Thioglobus sp.]
MLVKILVVIIFFLIIGSLVSALFHLLTSQQDNDKTLRALTFRIGLSVLAFVILIISANLGWIEPHGLGG